MAFARVLPLIKHHPAIRHGLLFTAVLPISIASLSLYHASQSPFVMVNKPFEAWNNQDYQAQKLFSTQNSATNHNERPYFEYQI